MYNYWFYMVSSFSEWNDILCLCGQNYVTKANRRGSHNMQKQITYDPYQHFQCSHDLDIRILNIMHRSLIKIVSVLLFLKYLLIYI